MVFRWKSFVLYTILTIVSIITQWGNKMKSKITVYYGGINY